MLMVEFPKSITPATGLSIKWIFVSFFGGVARSTCNRCDPPRGSCFAFAAVLIRTNRSSPQFGQRSVPRARRSVGRPHPGTTQSRSYLPDIHLIPSSPAPYLVFEFESIWVDSLRQRLFGVERARGWTENRYQSRSTRVCQRLFKLVRKDRKAPYVPGRSRGHYIHFWGYRIQAVGGQK